MAGYTSIGVHLSFTRDDWGSFLAASPFGNGASNGGAMTKARMSHLVVIIGVAAMVGAIAVWIPTKAAAGTGGQQIEFSIQYPTCPVGQLGSVAIVGANQNQDVVTWNGTSADGTDVVTTQWWWVGGVTVTYQVSGKNYTAFGWVTNGSVDGSDTETVTCGVNPSPGAILTQSDLPSGYTPSSVSSINVPNTCLAGNAFLGQAVNAQAPANGTASSAFEDSSNFDYTNLIGSGASYADTSSEAHDAFALEGSKQFFTCAFTSDSLGLSGGESLTSESVAQLPSPGVGDESAAITLTANITLADGSTAGSTDLEFIVIRTKQMLGYLEYSTTSSTGAGTSLQIPNDLETQFNSLIAERLSTVQLSIPATSPAPAPPPPAPTGPCREAVSVDGVIKGFPSVKLPLKSVSLPLDLGTQLSVEAKFANASVCTSALTAAAFGPAPTPGNPIASIRTNAVTHAGPFVYSLSKLGWTEHPGSPSADFQSHFEFAGVAPELGPTLNLGSGGPSLDLASINIEVASSKIVLVKDGNHLLEAGFGPVISISVGVSPKGVRTTAEKLIADGESEQTAFADAAEEEAGYAAVAIDQEIVALDPIANPQEVVTALAKEGDGLVVQGLTADASSILAAADASEAGALGTSTGAIDSAGGEAGIDGLLGDSVVEDGPLDFLLFALVP